MREDQNLTEREREMSKNIKNERGAKKDRKRYEQKLREEGMSKNRGNKV